MPLCTQICPDSVPPSNESSTLSVCPVYRQVLPGESCMSAAARFQIHLDFIIDWNPTTCLPDPLMVLVPMRE